LPAAATGHSAAQSAFAAEQLPSPHAALDDAAEQHFAADAAEQHSDFDADSAEQHFAAAAAKGHPEAQHGFSLSAESALSGLSARIDVPTTTATTANSIPNNTRVFTVNPPVRDP
jgi:hypothetical protein